MLNETQLRDLLIKYRLFQLFTLASDGLMLWNTGFKTKNTCTNYYQAKKEHRSLLAFEWKEVQEILKKMGKQGVIQKINPCVIGLTNMKGATCLVVADNQLFEKEKLLVLQELENLRQQQQNGKIYDQNFIEEPENSLKEKMVANLKNEKGDEKVMAEKNKLENLQDVEELLEELSKGPWNSFYRQIRKMFHHIRQMWLAINKLATNYSEMRKELEQLKKENKLLQEKLGVSFSEEPKKYKIYEIDTIAEKTQNLLGVKIKDEEEIADLPIKEKESEKTINPRVKSLLEEVILPTIKKKREV